jgi:hypothetical protein
LSRRTAEGTSLRFWKKRSGLEVDFVVVSGNRVLPVEAKWHRRPTVTAGLKIFLQTYRPSRAILATREFTDRKKVDGVPVDFIPAPLLA